MAKKSKRIIIQLQCTECKERNYTTSKSTVDKKGQASGSRKKLELKKYCSRCRKHTKHKEVRIPSPKK